MERKRFKFDVNTSTNCFICFDEIAEEGKNERKLFALQNIFRYLKIALRNIESLSEKPEGILNKTEVRVRLCKECLGTMKTFTELYKILELTKLKLNCTAGVLQKKLISTDKAGSNRLDDYQLKLESSSPSDLKALRHFKLAKELRNEIVEKCEKVAFVNQPTVKLAKLNNTEIQNHTTHSLTEELIVSKSASEHFQGTDSLPIIESCQVVIKQEIEEDDECYNDIIPESEGINQEDIIFDDNYGIEHTSMPSNDIECKPEVNFTTLQDTTTKKYKHLFDKVTGMYDCGFSSCSKQFKTKKTLQRHHWRHHQSKIKTSPSFKCSDQSCSSMFFDAASAKIHFESFHLQIRYKCDLCHLKFSQLHWLEKHRKDCTASASQDKVIAKLVYEKLQKITQSVSGKAKSMEFKCPEASCGLKFISEEAGQKHYKFSHLKTHYKCKCKKEFNFLKAFKRHKTSCPFRRKQSVEGKCFELDKNTLKYKCAECSCLKQFADRKGARDHFKSRHLSIRYKCENCGVRPFNTLLSLHFYQLKCTKGLNNF